MTLTHFLRHPSVLIYDTRYRSITLQMIALTLVAAAFLFLIRNTVSNLEALGKGVDFGFLGETAGYQINQRLIPYSPTDTHFRAAIVGLLNTLLLAGLGCVLATALGVLFGVMRLSSNWLTSRFAATYVETLRNVPVLLWILIVFTVMIDAMPVPRAFKNGEASMAFWESVAVTNRGIYIPRLTFEMTNGALIFLASIVACVVVFLVLKRRARSHQEATGDQRAVWLPTLIAGAALLGVTIVVTRARLENPALQGFNFQGGIHIRNSLIALWIALALYTSAYIAEAVRSGIQAVPKGQREAATALGLSSRQTLFQVILPQALRVAIPPTISQYLNLTKNTSLAIAVGYMDLTGTLMGVTRNQSGRELETVLLGMAFYLSVSISVSVVLNWYNAKAKLVER